MKWCKSAMILVNQNKHDLLVLIVDTCTYIISISNIDYIIFMLMYAIWYTTVYKVSVYAGFTESV